MKKFFWLFLGITSSIFATTQFSHQKPFFAELHENSIKKGYLFYMPTSLAKKDSWDAFHAAAFLLPALLHTIKHEQLPLVLCIPETLDGFSPIDKHAPLIEGARVSFAWASAFFRFKELGNIDARVLLVSSSDQAEDIEPAIAEALSLRFLEEQNAEVAFEKRIVHSSTLNKKKTTIEVHTIEIAPPYYECKTLTTDLKPCTSDQRRVLITGGAGFLGNHLARRYIEQGHQVIVIDNLFCSTGENINDLLSHPNFRFFNHDVSIPFDTNVAVDSVIHLASLPSPVDYYNHPLQTLEAGLMGTKQAVEFAMKKNARFFFSSTSEVYGDPEISPQNETYPGKVNPWGKRSQYDESKRGAETLLKLYFERHNLDIRIARIFNTYGPGMRLNDGRVITNFINSILHDKAITVFGDGLQTRSFGYVSDTVDGLFRLENASFESNTPLANRIFNVGNPGEFTIKELAEKTNELSLKYFQKPAHIINLENPDSTDPKQRCPDITRIKTLGYAPHVTLDEGLEKTFQFFFDKK